MENVERVEEVNEIFDQVEKANNESEVKKVGSEQNIKTYTCLLCNSIFTNDQNLLNHFSLLHEIEMFICRNCNKFFLVEETYKKHECCGSTQKINNLKRKKINPKANDENTIKENDVEQV